MLWDPAAHEPLAGEWDEGAAVAAIRTIAADAEEAFDEGWRILPRDLEPGEPDRWSGTYLGRRRDRRRAPEARRTRLVELRRDYVPYLEQLEPDEPSPSLMPARRGSCSCGSGSRRRPRHASGSAELVAENVGPSARSARQPGTMLAARELGFDDLWQECADRLLADA